MGVCRLVSTTSPIDHLHYELTIRLMVPFLFSVFFNVCGVINVGCLGRHLKSFVIREVLRSWLNAIVASELSVRIYQGRSSCRLYHSFRFSNDDDKLGFWKTIEACNLCDSFSNLLELFSSSLSFFRPFSLFLLLISHWYSQPVAINLSPLRRSLVDMCVCGFFLLRLPWLLCYFETPFSTRVSCTIGWLCRF